jgi:hypothetical protein
LCQVLELFQQIIRGSAEEEDGKNNALVDIENVFEEAID